MNIDNCTKVNLVFCNLSFNYEVYDFELKVAALVATQLIYF